MRLVTLVLRNLLRRRVRSVLSVLGAAVAIGTVVALVGISTGLERAFRGVYEHRGVDLVVIQAGSSQGLNSTIDETVGDEIAALPGVVDVSPGLIDAIAFEDKGLYSVLTHGWRTDGHMMDDFELLRGRMLEPGDTTQVILGSVLAKNLDVDVGDTLEIIEEEPFEVVGVYQSYNVYENGGLVVPLPELQRVMGWEGQVTGFTVTADAGLDDAAVEEIRARIEGMRLGLAAMRTEEHVATSTQMRIARAMAWVTSAIALVIGAAGMLNTMLMSVLERTREIGVLRAIGWRSASIVRLILMESVVLSVAGAALGSLAAVIGVKALSQSANASGFIDGRIEPFVILQGFLIALAFALLGGGYPAWRGSRMRPTEALRHE